jgi:hypothetical protein
MHWKMTELLWMMHTRGMGLLRGWWWPVDNKLHGFSPRANYTDRATVACRRRYCQLLRIEGCCIVSAESILLSSTSVVLTRFSEPRSRPTIYQKIWWHREPNPDLGICSQELWPLDHRGGLVVCRPEVNFWQRAEPVTEIMDDSL